MSDPIAPAADPELAALRRRGLFRYSDGVAPGELYADAVECQFRLAEACPDLAKFDALLATIAGPAGVGGEAEGEGPPAPAGPDPLYAAMMALRPIVDAMFGLPPFDPATGAGLSTRERLDLLGRFLVDQAAAAEDEDDGDAPDADADADPAVDG